MRWLPECPNAFRVPKSLSAQVSKCLGCPSAQVPSESPSALSAQVAWVPECPSALSVVSAQVPKCPSALSALSALSVKMPFECRVPKCPSAHRVPQVSSLLSVSGVRVPECLEYLECQSVSVNQLVIQQFSHLAYNAASVS